MISFFLGAGASSPFGYPVTKKFKDTIAAELDNKFEREGNLPEAEKILISILKHETYQDIEYVLEFWKRLSELKKREENAVLIDFLSSYRFQAEFRNVYRNPHIQSAELKTFFDYGDSLMDFIVNKLYDTYSLKPQNVEKSQNIYSSLFSIGNQDLIEIFTTNYDSIIEEYCKEVQYNLIDGFEYDNSSGLKKWKPSLFDAKLHLDRKCISLYKLHGSLNWKRHKKYGIVKLEGVEKRMKDDWQYSDDLLVKPTLSPKEEEGEEPFRTLISKFNEKLRENDICIVIGYSFRDRRINEILYQFPIEGRKLIIVSPSARSNFEKNLSTMNKAYNKNNCIYIEEKVSDDKIDNVVQRIQSYL